MSAHDTDISARRIALERASAAREALERAAKAIEQRVGGRHYQAAFKVAAQVVRGFKPD